MGIMGVITTLPQRPCNAKGRVWALWPRARPPLRRGRGLAYEALRRPILPIEESKATVHKPPLDAHMTGGEGRHPGARGCGCGLVLLSESYIFGGTEGILCYPLKILYVCETGLVPAVGGPRPRPDARPAL